MSYAPIYGPDFANGALSNAGSYTAIGWGPKSDTKCQTGVRQVHGVDGILREQAFITYDGNIEVGVTKETWGFIALAIRASGSAYHGTQTEDAKFYVGDANRAVEAKYCVVDKLTLRWQGGDNPLEATLGVMSRFPNPDASSSSQVALASSVRYLRRHMTLTVADGAYVRGFELSIDNKYKRVATGQAVVSGQELVYDRVEQGIAEVRFWAEVEQPPSFTAATPSAALGATLAFDNAVTGGAKTVTLANMSLAEVPYVVAELREGRKVYRYEFDCLPDSASIA